MQPSTYTVPLYISMYNIESIGNLQAITDIQKNLNANVPFVRLEKLMQKSTCVNYESTNIFETNEPDLNGNFLKKLHENNTQQENVTERLNDSTVVTIDADWFQINRAVPNDTTTDLHIESASYVAVNESDLNGNLLETYYTTECGSLDKDNTAENSNVKDCSSDLLIADASSVVHDALNTNVDFLCEDESEKFNDSDEDYLPSENGSTNSDEIEKDTTRSNGTDKNNTSLNSSRKSNSLELSLTTNRVGTCARDDMCMYVASAQGTKKRNCCYYCNTFQTKIGRHLERVHRDESEVRKFADLPKGCIERKKIIETLRKNGNFKFNIDNTVENNELIVCRRPSKNQTKLAVQFTACAKCKGFFSKNTIRHHFRRCTGRSSLQNRTIMVLGRQVIGRIHPVACNTLRRMIFPVLRENDVTRLIRYDELIIMYGNKLCAKYKLGHQHDMIRARLRLLGRFLAEIKCQNQEITDLASLFYPKFYDFMISAINVIAGYDESNGSYKTPSVATCTGTMIKQAGNLLVTVYIKKHDNHKKQMTEDFLKLLLEDYSTSINKLAIESQMKQKRHKKNALPSMDDIRKLHTYLEQERHAAYQSLSCKFSYNAWLTLAETTLISVQLFNRRRAGEIERVFIEDFNCRKRIDESTHKDLYRSLSKQSQEIARKYSRFTIRGKLGRTVSVLLHSELLQCIELILKFRKKAKVNEKNPFLFGIAHHDINRYKHLKACDLMRRFAFKCGAQFPDTLRGTKLRKHIATRCITLNLSEHEVSDLANFMGHAEKIHKEHYRQPIISREILRMSQLLEAAQGIDDMNENVESEDSDQNEDLPDDEDGVPVSILSSTANTDSFDISEELESTSDINVTQQNSTSQKNKLKRRSTSPYGRTKRTRWNEREKDIVLKAFGQHIRDTTLPSLREIQELITKKTLHRTPAQVKTWIHNQKKKLE